MPTIAWHACALLLLLTKIKFLLCGRNLGLCFEVCTGGRAAQFSNWRIVHASVGLTVVQPFLASHKSMCSVILADFLLLFQAPTL